MRRWEFKKLPEPYGQVDIVNCRWLFYFFRFTFLDSGALSVEVHEILEDPF